MSEYATCPQCGGGATESVANSLTKAAFTGGSALVAAASGAAAGSAVVPIVGTVIGAVSGYLLGKRVAQEAGVDNQFVCQTCNHKFNI